MNEPEVNWLTQETYDRLKHELDMLIANRPVIAAEISSHREEGDLSENAAYHAVREEQGQQEGRIRQLEALLRDAEVGQVPQNTGFAEPGMLLTVRYEDTAETETFLLATRAEDETGPIEVYSPHSPLGHALLGAKEGETRHYELPYGGSMRVTLINVEPYHG